jgi:predicted TPR repeat methyltransferase
VEPDDAAPRELTRDEAVTIAVLLQQHGRLAEAGELFTRVLADEPAHARALHYAGVLAHQQGRTADALALIERSLSSDAEQPDAFNNLGIILQAAGRLDDAVGAYRKAIALNPAHANAHSNLGILLKAQGQPVEAEAAYRAAIALEPDHVDAYTNLGILLNALNRTEEASRCFSRAITLRPHHPEARKLLALAHCALGETDRAVAIFEEWLAEEPDSPIARHMLAAVSRANVPSRASDAFVVQTFDRFAASFEQKLERLAYRAPALVAATLEEALGTAAGKTLDVLDAGCGTGLCGPFLAPRARTLSGVDLSDGMLALAREKGLYDRLVCAELTAFLSDSPERFDVIVSADTLVYFGDLREALSAAAAALRPGGWVVFTLEHAASAAPAPADSGAGYRLESHGRYTHERGYVERALGEAGLEPDIREAELRLEGGIPVAGLVVRAKRPMGAANLLASTRAADLVSRKV